MLKKYRTPSFSPYRYEDFYASTGTYYVERNRYGKCISCKWCNPERYYDFKWLRTEDGNVVSRGGYCYCKADGIVMRASDGCRHYEKEEDREVIDVDELR